MGEVGPVSIAVVCEAPADQETACGLADHVFCAAVDWLEPELLDGARRWRGFEADRCFVRWSDVPAMARTRGIRAPGHFQGQPGAPHARCARLALLLFVVLDDLPEAMLLIRDTDGDRRRQVGLEQARNDSDWPFRVALGLAHTKRECWVLAGFEPVSDAEHQRLGRIRQELGFDPCEHADDLTAQDESARHSAKRVLDKLCGSDRDRERACWIDADLDLLAHRGAGTGLADYFAELRQWIVPLLAR